MRAIGLTITFLLCSCAAPSETTPPIDIAPTSTLPLSEAEISFYASKGASKDANAEEICIADKLRRYSQKKNFGAQIENHIQCSVNPNPRQAVINYILDDSIGVCADYKSCPNWGFIPTKDQTVQCPIVDACWDGIFPDLRNPCDQFCARQPPFQ